MMYFFNWRIVVRDYRITVKVRNSRLLTAIEKSGNKPGAKFSKVLGIRYHVLLDYINCTRVPFDEDLNLKPCAEKICAFFNKLPNELWSEKQLTPLTVNTLDMEVSSEHVVAYLQNCSNRTTDPLELLECNETSKMVDNLLENLTPREAEVISLRYGFTGEEKTLNAVGNIINVTQERVRQIESRAIRKLRHPNNWESIEIAPYSDTKMSDKDKLFSIQMRYNNGKGIFCVRLIHQRLVEGYITEAKSLIDKHWDVIRQYPEVCEHLYYSNLLDAYFEESIALRTNQGDYEHGVIERIIYENTINMLTRYLSELPGHYVYTLAKVITAAIGFCRNNVAADVSRSMFNNMSLSKEKRVEISNSIKNILKDAVNLANNQ